MQRIAEFMKVSSKQFCRDWKGADAEKIYTELRLPRRATIGSAGYDFFAPQSFTLEPGAIITIATGVRARIEPGWLLAIAPRSGQGFKYRVQLYNTLGIIDSDYFDAENEGHIHIKLVNANTEGKTLFVEAGTAFAQGIFLPYGITTDDSAASIRVGGFGSTDT